jgi:hypothetical protein
MENATRTRLFVILLLFGSSSIPVFAQYVDAEKIQRNPNTRTSTTSNPKIVPYVPRTAAGSAYMNALQGFLNTLAARSAPSAAPAGGEPTSATAPSASSLSALPFPLIDTDTFAHAGPKDAISQNIDDLLDHCPDAVRYVDSPEFVGEFDRAFKQYTINKQGQASIHKIEADLLSDTWWARSSGPDVAREVKFVADSLNDILGMIAPEGEAVNSIKSMDTFGTVTSDNELDSELVGHTRDAVDTVKNAYDRKDNVDQQTRKVAADLAEFAAKEILKKTRYARVVPFVNFAEHFYERAKTEEDGANFKAEVQSQIQNLNIRINILQNQADDAGKAASAIEALHDAVMAVCVPTSIPINNSAKD